MPWKIDAAVASWISISPTEGPAGETAVQLTIVGDASSTRTEFFTVSPSGSNTPAVSFTVEQKVYTEEWKKNFGGSNADLCEGRGQMAVLSSQGRLPALMGT